MRDIASLNTPVNLKSSRITDLLASESSASDRVAKNDFGPLSRGSSAGSDEENEDNDFAISF